MDPPTRRADTRHLTLSLLLQEIYFDCYSYIIGDLEFWHYEVREKGTELLFLCQSQLTLLTTMYGAQNICWFWPELEKLFYQAIV